jgi:exopolyphosphatase / guanosine-5'-triphosphate,3'-diphosphate pyrophosphatase
MRPEKPRVVAFVDMGTNSVRLMIARFESGKAYKELSLQKEMIRLGEGQFDDDKIKPEAMERAVAVCRNFVNMAKTFGADEIVAVATSATRDASNQKEFLELLRNEAGIEMNLVSGKEEARLIYLGVSRGDKINGPTLFIDIGGGSTEVIVGDNSEYSFLDSMKLGAIRLSMKYTEEIEGPVPLKLYAMMCDHVKNTSIRPVQSIRAFGIKEALGSSGTAQNLAEIAKQVIYKGDESRKSLLRLKDLKQISKLLCSLPLRERRNVPGMNPKRADIIIAGAAILETILSETGIHELRISTRELRDGLLIDYLDREYGHETDQVSIRMSSVLNLGRKCGFDEKHAMTVARLCLEMFDTARDIGLHRQGTGRRELLHCSAVLHDIGAFLSYSNHHANSSYFIRNAELLGFNQREILVMAANVFFHRRGSPGRKGQETAGLDERSVETIKVHSILLRIAESLDRSHAGLISHARFKMGKKNMVILELGCDMGCDLETWGAENHRDAFSKVFGKKLAIKRSE